MDGNVWIEDQSFTDNCQEIGRLTGMIEAKNEEIKRLIYECNKAVDALRPKKPAQQ